MHLIVGLGNPGKRYAKTRHNVGFMVLDALHKKLAEYGISSWELSTKFNAEVAGCSVKGEKILLAKPMTFMNASGQSVLLLGQYYKIPVREVLIIHDDKDLKLGTIKRQTERGAAGHNGVVSIIEHVGNKELNRIRVGIASENEKKMTDTATFVLGKFGLTEKKKLGQAIDDAAHDAFIWLQG